MTDISDLPPFERIKRYRELADAARGFAAASRNGSVKLAYTLIAEQWEQLADDTRAFAKKLDETGGGAG